MDEKFNNLIEILKKEKMTEAESANLYFRINSYRAPNPVRSPYLGLSPLARFSRFAGAFAILAVVSVTGLSYASASALPGDPLYAIKINLKEKLEDKLVFSSERRIALHQQRIEVRFSEVKSLIKEKKITQEKLSVVAAKIQEEQEKIGTAIEEINKENPEAALSAKTDLEASIQEHKDKIDTLIEENISVNGGEDINFGDVNLGNEETPVEELPPVEENPEIPTEELNTNPDMDPDTSVIEDFEVLPDSSMIDILPPLANTIDAPGANKN